jgi:phage-related protein (TIGR01555 family)
MRGWGDSIFTHVNEVLSQYSQTWSATAILMQEWSQGVLKMKGLARLLSNSTKANQELLAQRALALQMTQSIARTRIIDSEEEYSREVTPLSGIADVLEQFALRLAAAAGIPLSLLMGQTKGGLGDAGNTDARFFYDRVAAAQRERMLPQLNKLHRLAFLAKDSPTRGTLPERWHIEMRPLFQPTEKEEIENHYKQAQTDQIYIDTGVLTPEEVSGSRFGGSKWSADTVLDLDGRAEMAKVLAAPAPKPALGAPKPAMPNAAMKAAAPETATSATQQAEPKPTEEPK